MLTPAQIAAIAAKALDEKKARDVKVLKTTEQTVLADYFVICNGTSSTHIKALVDEVDKQLSEAGEPPMRREGLRSDIWVLMDFGCVIVHVFTDEARKFYNLERLWSGGCLIPSQPLRLKRSGPAGPGFCFDPMGRNRTRDKILQKELIHHEIRFCKNREKMAG